MDKISKSDLSIKSTLLLMVLLFISSCTSDPDFDFPIVQTGDIVKIEASGVTFAGKLINAPGILLDYGFVWDLVPNPTLELSFSHSFGANTEFQFTYTATSGLVAGRTYYVRAYAVDQNYISYGRSVEFTSIGNSPPVIIDFSPKLGTWGDTVAVFGNNLSPRGIDNTIRIGESVVNIISSNDSELKFIVPLELNIPQATIMVNSFGLSGSSAEKFNLRPPVIDRLSNLQGGNNSNLTIHGKYFNPLFTEVFFGNVELLIDSTTENEVNVNIPSWLPEGEYSIKIIVATQEVMAESKFTKI